MPQQEMPGPNVGQAQGNVQQVCCLLVRQPIFTTTDLMKWKWQYPPYTEKPQALTELMESIFQNHKPGWADCHELLLNLFTTEERRSILQASVRWLEETAPAEEMDPQAYAQRLLPSEDPNWDPNSAEGTSRLMVHREALLQGMRRGVQKATNISKVTEVLQGPNESPGAFYERLCEAYHVYTPFDPQSPENQSMVNIAFVSQSASDIRCKLQKLEDFMEMNSTQLVQVANRVFTNRHLEKNREEERRMKKMADSVVGVLMQLQVIPSQEKKAPLRRDWCAFCGEIKHWKC